MQEVAIRVEKLNKRYRLYERGRDRIFDALSPSGRPKRGKDFPALKDVDLTVYKGETVGIIGTNGSGKSTILKIITGVLTPSDGEVEVNGRISALLELGAGFNLEYNGIENIYLNGTMIGFSEEEIKQKLPDILAFADIGDYVYQPVKMYSSGMFMRLAFAVAINIDPEILIVDEALSVGDVFFQAKCYRKFEEFKKQGKTVLFVSHDLSSISKYCDRVVVLNKGVKLGEGAPKQMIDLYKQVLVGQYEEQADHHAAVSENPDALEYGSKKAVITSFGVRDENGVENATVLKGAPCEFHMIVEFMEDIEAPVFAVSIKNIQGVEITGTNTMAEKAFLESVRKGEVKKISFRQKIDLQGGEYLLSFGVTGFEKENFTVYHRLYDVLNLTVVSDKNTVGYYDMNTKITVE
ncbi:MAG: ABC transporter ATP-binding protein [Lachnospiraceae bacterium]|nr:ABC transporter ATP-binding protein [Lachnospiraceae bacterium]